MPTGVKVRAAWRRDDELETAWPGSAPTDPGVGHLIPIRGETITMATEDHDVGTLSNQVSKERTYRESIKAPGSIECELRYGGLDRLWAALMGYENPDTDASGGSPHTLASGEYQHVYEVHKYLRSVVWDPTERNASTGSPGDPGYWTASDRKQCRGGLYIDKQTSVWRAWPMMVNNATVNLGRKGGTVSFDMLGYQLTHGGSTYNKANWDWFGGQTLSSPGMAPVTLPQLTVKMASAGGSAWIESNARVTEFTLNVQNKLTEDPFASGDYNPLEFWRDGMRSVTGGFTVVRYTNTIWDTIQDSDSRMQLLFDCVGPSLGTNNARLAFYIPECKLSTDDVPVPGPQVLTQRVEFEAYLPSTATTSLVTGAGGMLENITTRKGGELVIGTTNAYSENVFEYD